MTQLQELLARRTGGQVNIRGLCYQLLYALRRGMELMEVGCAFSSIGLERFEDVDLYGTGDKPFRIGNDGTDGSNIYVQVKTCDGRWFWSNLKKPIKGFIEVMCADPEGQCLLVLDFQLDGEPLDLANFATLSAKRQRAITSKFRSLCQSNGMGGTIAEANKLLARLQIVTIPEADLLNDLRLRLIEIFELHGAGVERYLSIFIEKFLDWSRERKVISRDDLTRLGDGIAHDFALENAYEAFGRGLLLRANWETDARPEDFYEGKATRAGHIACDLDVVRPVWHKRIKNALSAAGTVIVRASSGQGKSTLALRFARDEWPAADTFILKTAQTPAEVEMVCSVLQHRVVALGLPTYLLLDNAGRQTQEWPRVAQECSALNIPVLATLRQEDWYRFARTHRFSYEPIEPSLDIDEAWRIYDVMSERERIHVSVVSAEWAFEKIGEPRLLMEYVYLLTHGQMLEERLSDQLAEIETHENAAKLEILRRVALADALSAPVMTDRLCQGVAHQPGFSGDARQLVRSLEDEYLKRYGDRLGGLHWVRSDHLVRLLHDDPRHLADTAIQVLRAVPLENLSDAVANALGRADLDREHFRKGLFGYGRALASDKELPELLALIGGVFEAGERHFLETNRAPFDEAHHFIGQSGPFMLKMECAPTLNKKFLSSFRKSMGSGGLDTLLAISKRLKHGARGCDEVRQFLVEVAPALTSESLLSRIGETGDLLAWLGWCEVPCAAYDAARESLLQRAWKLDFDVRELQRFAQGLWLFDCDGYREWLEFDPQKLNGYLRWQLDCLKIEREDVSDPLKSKEGAQGELSVEFLAVDYEKAHQQTIERLEILYSLFPFYARYKTQGIWPFMSEMKLWHDPTTKALAQGSQCLRFHAQRNETWSHIVESHYMIDNYYTYQQQWHDLRRECLEFLGLLCRRLRAIFAARVTNFTGAFPGDIIGRTEHLLTQIPLPPPQTSDEIQAVLKPLQNWTQHWRSFRGMLLETAVYLNNHGHLAAKTENSSEQENEAAHTQHLTWHNFREVCKHLPAMHSAMRALFEVTADYFGATALDADEKRVYAEADELLDVWLKHPLPVGTHSVEARVSNRRRQEQRDLIARLHQALEPLELQGMSFLYPQDVIEDFPLKMLPLGFSVDDVCRIEGSRDRVLNSLLDSFEKDADFLWLVPVQDGARALEGGFRVATGLPDEESEDAQILRAWTINEQAIPDNVWQVLPPLPVRVLPRLKLIATARGLVLRLDGIMRARSLVDDLLASNDVYDAKLYEKHRAQLLTEQSVTGVDYDIMRQTLAQEFGTRSGEWCYEAAKNLLEI